MKIPIAVGLCELLAIAVSAADVTITSLDCHGQLTWTNTVSNATYRVEWASSATGPWQQFEALTNLSRVQASNTTVTVTVPMFYRVVWTDAPPQPGRFVYQGFNPEGILLVTGQLHLEWVTNLVIGTWAFDYVGPGSPETAGREIGPQIGQGELEGYWDGSRFLINLNKGWADNNVFLDGVYDGTIFQGRWGWSTFGGERTNGTFVAHRITP